MRRVAGIEIGGTKLQVVFGSPDGRIEKCWRGQVDPDRGAEGIREQLQAVIADWLMPHAPEAVAVGFGGPVDRLQGILQCSHQIEGWRGFALRDWVQALCGVPVCVENDANVAALGEALCGAGRGFDPVFWINMGSGVGGGLVVDGKLYHGCSPGEAEIGHVRLDRTGTLLEERCSGWALDARIRDVVGTRTDDESALARCVLQAGNVGGESRWLARALQEKDALALFLLEQWADDLAFGLGHVVQLFHPQAIILGGGLSLVGLPLLRVVQDALPRYVMDAFQPGPTLFLAGLGEGAVPAGCLLLAGQHLDGPIH